MVGAHFARVGAGRRAHADRPFRASAVRCLEACAATLLSGRPLRTAARCRGRAPRRRRRAGVRDRRAHRHRRRPRRASLSVSSDRGSSRRPARRFSSWMRAGSRSMIRLSARDCANGSRRCARRTPPSCSRPSRWPISRPARSRPAIIESCPTRLFLPNERAVEPQILSIYRRFGLNDRQIEIIARATPKRDYYCQSRRGNRLFELGLGEVALAFTAASSKTDQAAIAEVMLEHGRDGFAAAWLRRKGLDWAADLSTPSSPRRTTSSHLPCGQSHEPSPHSAHGR